MNLSSQNFIIEHHICLNTDIGKYDRFISSFSTLCRKKNFLDHLKLCYTMAFSILKNKGGSYNSKSLRQISCHPHFFGEVENWVEVLPKLYSTSTCFVAYIQLSTCRRNTPIYFSSPAFWKTVVFALCVNIFVFFH